MHSKSEKRKKEIGTKEGEKMTGIEVEMETREGGNLFGVCVCVCVCVFVCVFFASVMNR